MKKLLLLIIVLNLLYCKSINSQIIIKPWDKLGLREANSLDIASLNNKYGLVDDNNKIYLPFVYDSINYIDYASVIFYLFKNGKKGFASQQEIVDSITKQSQHIVTKIDAIYDSIQTKRCFIKVYNKTDLYIYWFDGSLLFPYSKYNNICDIRLKFGEYDFPINSKERKKYKSNYKSVKMAYNYAYKIFNKNKYIYDTKFGAQYYDHILFYNNKYYRINPIIDPYNYKPMTVTQIKLSRYFSKQVKKDKNHCCIE